MTPQELDICVARKADTPGLQISVAEVARVRSVLFMELSRLPATECAETFAGCLRSAEAHRQDEAVSDDPA